MAYGNGQTDEFVEPTVILDNGKPQTVNDNDAVLFFNFRIDRPRQLTMAFVAQDFKELASSWEFDPYAVKYEAKESRAEQKIILKDPFPREKIVKNLFVVVFGEAWQIFQTHFRSVRASPIKIIKNVFSMTGVTIVPEVVMVGA